MDYHRDNAYIRSMKYKWIEPPKKEKKVRKLPTKSDMEEMDKKMSPARKIMKAVTDRVHKGSAKATKPLNPKTKRPVNKDKLRGEPTSDLGEDSVETQSQKLAKTTRKKQVEDME